MFAYQRLVLGTTPEHSGRFVVTSFDSEAGVLLARSRANAEFADRVAFAAAIAPADATTHVSGDREAFLGRGHSLDLVAQLRQDHLEEAANALYEAPQVA